ncbi:MAG: tRNA lysidine(34) synthetase TilS [Clostridia bacterium]|nr:tRNA lysidine(34) synthetase TilS [Clostridia bacterium]
MVNLRDYNGKIICAAVSGGVDSVSLLHYLKEMELKNGYHLCAVNFEHGIRGEESLADTEFVKALCEKMQVPLYCFSENCVEKSKKDGVGLEESARNFRREGYFSLLKAGKADVIATAHHADDLAETALFRLCRGCSLGGVMGIEEKTETFVRPFLSWTKAEIYAYAVEHNLSYREDLTNFVADVTRNKIRLEVLPTLETAVPSAKKGICRFAALAKADDEYLCKIASSLVVYEDGCYQLKYSPDLPIFRRACLSILKSLGIDKDYTSVHLESVFALQSSPSSSVCLPKGIVAKKQGNRVVFLTQKEQKQTVDKNLSIPFQLGEFDVGRYSLSISLEERNEDGMDGFKPLFFDLDKIPQGAVIRFRKTGDEIEKFGGGTKPLKKFLTDKKIPAEVSEGLPIIAEDNQVYAVCGVEISDKIKVTDSAKKRAYITLTKK